MLKQKIGVIVQARMGSSRLPGKVLMNIDKNERVLDLLIKRLKYSKYIDLIIIATTPNSKDSLIIDAAKALNVSYFVGSENNVLKRYYEAAKKFKLDVIIRVTSDCPFIDHQILDDMIDFYIKNKYDYLRNVDESTNFPRGFDIEVFSFNILQKVFFLAKNKPEKEHVTYFIYTHPEIFKIYNFNLKNIKKFENLRLTIDEKDDLIMCKEIYERLKENGKKIDFSIFDIIDIIDKNPKLMEINKNVKQKKV